MNTASVFLDGGASIWSWHPHPDVWLFVFVAGVAYLGAVEFLGSRYTSPGETAASRKHLVLFFSGLLTIWIASEWPIHDMAENYLYSMHMVQHMLLTLVAPPLVLMGMPPWLLRRILTARYVYPVTRIALKPLPALVAFNAMIVITHLPDVVNASLDYHWLHFLLHAGLVLTALQMWWPVVSPLKELPRLSYPGQMIYLFAQSIVPTVPASFLTFSGETIYSYYETVPRLWGISAMEDQRIAGLLMKIAGGLYLWGIVTVLFFKWFAEEEAEETEALRWRDVERELDRMGLKEQ